MRILITTNAAVGHLLPMVPTAAALLAAGHDVRVACPAGFAPFVERCGLRAVACEERAVDPRTMPPPPPDDVRGRLVWAVTLSWPSDCRPWVDALLGFAREWRPELVIVEPVEHAGRVVAAALGVPVVVHGWGFTLPAGVERSAAAGLADLYRAVGAEPVPPRLLVELGPARLQPPGTVAVRRHSYVPSSIPGEPLPPPTPGVRRALVTLGTYADPRAAGRLRAAISAALSQGLEVVAVLGNADRETGAALPAAAIVVRWTDMAAATASSDLVIHHGGAGTSWTTLVAGRPAVVMPQAGDQFDNARLLAEAGTARVVEDPAALDATVRAVLEDRSLAERAGQIARANALLPGPAALAGYLAERFSGPAGG